MQRAGGVPQAGGAAEPGNGVLVGRRGGGDRQPPPCRTAPGPVCACCTCEGKRV